MSGFGRKQLDQTGRNIMVAADPSVEFKSGGVTLDWDTVTAAGSDDTLPDGTPVKEGEKVIPMGTILTKITASGKYGPADTTATDGRENLNRGEVFIANQTIKESDLASAQRGVIEGGRVYEDRIRFGENDQPAKSDVLAEMPRLVLVSD